MPIIPNSYTTMKIIDNNNGQTIKIFAETIEQTALDQIKELSESVYCNEKIRIMPDVHAGAGCTIGTTMTISDKITPNLVGVDIGCGMLALRIESKNINLELLDSVVQEYIPSGQNINDIPKATFDFNRFKCSGILDHHYLMRSIGSLGGGNHFIEVAESSKSAYYLIIHSGSRRLGVDVCKHYQKKCSVDSYHTEINRAIEQLKAEGRYTEIEGTIKSIKANHNNNEMPYLEGNDFWDYLHDMRIAQEFAQLNRYKIASEIAYHMSWVYGEHIETVHNYIDFNRMILRKGAVRAEQGESFILPMNMRDGSLICIGKGNEDWNYSAPHGAGRLMSRSAAKQNLSMETFKSTMEGIFTTSVCESTLDEAPEAYKPMEEILNQISDTATVVDVLAPIYNFKSKN